MASSDLTLLMKHPRSQACGAIIPTRPYFGMDSLFRQFGIYASQGQLYSPRCGDVSILQESQDGQILEEGITEAVPWPPLRPPVPLCDYAWNDSVLLFLFHVRLPARGD